MITSYISPIKNNLEDGFFAYILIRARAGTSVLDTSTRYISTSYICYIIYNLLRKLKFYSIYLCVFPKHNALLEKARVPKLFIVNIYYSAIFQKEKPNAY